MFVEACEKMKKFTHPLVMSVVYADGRVTSSVGAYFFINREGWVITAAHVLDPIRVHAEDQTKFRENARHNSEHPEDIRNPDPSWIKAQSVWWGHQNIRYESVKLIGELDLALVKLVNIPEGFVTEYPVFKNPDKIVQGLSVCRGGYPFFRVNSTFDESKNAFALINVMPGSIPFFPNDGIISGKVFRGTLNPDGSPAPGPQTGILPMYLQTSTPGLKGQSGGPVVDVEGNIVGMQSQTQHLDLGFGDIQVNGKYMPEQFLNVGLAVDVQTIIRLLEKEGVKYKSESDDDGYRIIG